MGSIINIAFTGSFACSCGPTRCSVLLYAARLLHGGSLDADVAYLALERVGSGVIANGAPAGRADRKARLGLLRDQAGGLALGHLLSVDQEGQSAIRVEGRLHQEMAVAQRVLGDDRRQLPVFADGKGEFPLGEVDGIAAGAAALRHDHAFAPGRLDLGRNLQCLAGDVRRPLGWQRIARLPRADGAGRSAPAILAGACRRPGPSCRRPD